MFFSEVLPSKIKRRDVVRFDLKGLDRPENVAFFFFSFCVCFLSQNGKNLKENSLAAKLHGVSCFFLSPVFTFSDKRRRSSVFLKAPHTNNRFTV